MSDTVPVGSIDNQIAFYEVLIPKYQEAIKQIAASPRDTVSVNGVEFSYKNIKTLNQEYSTACTILTSLRRIKAGKNIIQMGRFV